MIYIEVRDSLGMTSHSLVEVKLIITADSKESIITAYQECVNFFGKFNVEVNPIKIRSNNVFFWIGMKKPIKRSYVGKYCAKANVACHNIKILDYILPSKLEDSLLPGTNVQVYYCYVEYKFIEPYRGIITLYRKPSLKLQAPKKGIGFFKK